MESAAGAGASGKTAKIAQTDKSIISAQAIKNAIQGLKDNLSSLRLHRLRIDPPANSELAVHVLDSFQS
jgi:hypothetical protein